MESQKRKYVVLRKVFAGGGLLSFLVITYIGIEAHHSMTTLSLRATASILLFGVVGRIVIRILMNYEDINGGKS
jgi:hypothetical protein